MKMNLNVSGYEALPYWGKVLVITVGVVLLAKVVIPALMGLLAVAFGVQFALLPLAILAGIAYWVWNAAWRSRRAGMTTTTEAR